MQRIQLEENELFHIPNNCWAFDANTKKLIPEKTVNPEKASEIILIPKVAGG